jgi:hypothetical protein
MLGGRSYPLHLSGQTFGFVEEVEVVSIGGLQWEVVHI